VTPEDVCRGRRDAMPDQRKRLAVRATVAWREDYRRVTQNQATEESGTPSVQLGEWTVPPLHC